MKLRMLCQTLRDIQLDMESLVIYIYIDNETQLKALKHSSMSLRDVHDQFQDSLGIKVVVSTAKAHSERGRVECKIRSLRKSLEKMGVNTNHPQTVL